eukprot:CAMPEP_0202963518 /NCGR_PEP_ID=MMETSP1396-20130829/7521_1 /ASSEMBLY_ACC=CAM_ASM_000872 /TAXON_ID= /ORGANISM="Pseudokeronopsis sp., Strain Brazil" /LENGTH=72 /DNA_ID=CAMNT_0049684801 /DNA_START=426 /DNA_END=644 /DNA_ORIENTATION=-
MSKSQEQEFLYHHPEFFEEYYGAYAEGHGAFFQENLIKGDEVYRMPRKADDEWSPEENEEGKKEEGKEDENA